jgi:hypothetical protein
MRLIDYRVCALSNIPNGVASQLRRPQAQSVTDHRYGAQAMTGLSSKHEEQTVLTN